MGWRTRIGTRFLTRVGGAGAPRPAGPAPADLAEAIVALHAETAGLAALAPRIYQAEAGQVAALPYVVFTIARAPTVRLTSTSAWHDAVVRFEAFAATAEAAQAIADAVLGAFKGAALAWAGGYAIPLVPADRSRSAEPRRSRGNARAARSVVQFSARCREER